MTVMHWCVNCCTSFWSLKVRKCYYFLIRDAAFDPILINITNQIFDELSHSASNLDELHPPAHINNYMLYTDAHTLISHPVPCKVASAPLQREHPREPTLRQVE